MLPHVIAFNASVNESHETEVTKRYAQVAEILNLQRSTAKQSVMALMAAIKRMSQAFGIPNTLEDLGIDRAAFEKMIPEMAKRVMADACTPTNPRPVTLKDIETIYRGL